MVDLERDLKRLKDLAYVNKDLEKQIEYMQVVQCSELSHSIMKRGKNTNFWKWKGEILTWE